MGVQEQATAADGIGFGLVLIATGGYFVLAGMGALPLPSEGGLNAPLAIVACAGAAFLFAGFALLIRAKAGADDRNSELPADAPRWAQATYRIVAIAIAGSLAAIGTWIAIGSGPRAFSVSGPLVGMHPAGDTLGRTMFGLGAVIVWFYVIALTVSTVRKMFDRAQSGPR